MDIFLRTRIVLHLMGMVIFGFSSDENFDLLNNVFR